MTTPILAEALWNPRSVALVGASNVDTRPTARPLDFLRASGWAGSIQLVNPRHRAIGGIPCVPSIADLPERPDHAFLMTNTVRSIDDVRECARLGVPVVTVLASGFAEAGGEGRDRQRELLAAIEGSGTRLIGPSSLGLVDVASGLTLTANAAFAETGLPPGGLFVASQSGSMIGAIASRGRAVGVGFAGFVSTGGEADLSLGELCASTLDRDDVDSYALFLESVPDIGQLESFALAAAEADRPVVALRIGRSDAAAALSQSHTGALAGDSVLSDEVLSRLGIITVHSLDALVETPRLAGVVRRPTRPARATVVTTTGGGGALMVDELEQRGVSVAGPSTQLRQRLRDIGIKVSDSPLIDLTLEGANYDTVVAGISELLASPEFDIVVAVPGSSARLRPDLTVTPIIDAAGEGAHLAVWPAPDAVDAVLTLRSAGLAPFRTETSCADAVAAALARRQPKAIVRPAVAGLPRRSLNEVDSYRILDELGVPHAPLTIIDRDHESSGRLDTLEFPVVVKALSADLPHKTDHGAVVADLATIDDVCRAITTITTNVGRSLPGLTLDGFLVQPFVQDAILEVLVGYRVDPDLGPIVVLAAGGVEAELHGDRSVRIAPVDLAEAREMIDEVRALRLARGFRGRPVGDLEALARAIVALSGAGSSERLIVEAEVNPVLVMREGAGVVAVDALVVIAERE